MAEGKSVGGLYMRLGLSLDELQSGFIAAEKTVQQNIARLNRENNLVRLRADIEISGLDAAKDATKILEIQEQALTRQLELQRDKLRLVSAAYREAAQNKNVNEAATQKLEASMERERLAVARLEAELKKLSSQKVSIDTTHVQDAIAKLNTRIKNIRIQAEIDTSRLKDAGSIFEAQKAHISAVTRELELQRQKYAQLQVQIMDAAKNFGGDSSVTLNIKTNALQQYQEIQKLEQKLKELQSTNVNLQIKAENLQKVEQSINEKISRINATVDLIRVKTEVDTSKLGAAASEFDKAKLHVSALTKELELQNQKLAELKKSYSTSVSLNGLNSVKSISLAADIQKQIQAIDQLKAKIKELNSIEPPKSGLLSGYLGIKGDITGQLNNIANAFSQLKGATSSADSAIVSVLGTIDAIPSPAGKAVAALAGLPIIFAGIENSIVDMMKASAAAGDSVYVMSRGFQMSVKDTGKFTTACKTAGVEVNDAASSIKRLQQQIIRGGDDSKAAQWLKRYGESAFDANGKLKDLNEMTMTLSRALKKAQADGRGMEFILATMRNASADTITFIEDAEGVYEQASHIVKAGLANPVLAHEVQGNLNAMGVQSAQLGTSFKNALLPVTNEIVPRMTERMGNLTQLIKDNKDIIIDLGKDFAQVWGAVEDTIDNVAEGLGVFAKLARENRVVRKTDSTDIVKKYKDDASVQSAGDILEKEIANGGYSDEDIERLRRREDLYKKEVARTNSDLKKLYEERRKDFAEANKSIIDKYKYDDSIKTATDLFNKLTDAEKEAISNVPSAFGSIQERAAVLNKELQRVREEAKATAAEVKNFKSVADDLSTAGLERQKLGDDTDALESLQKARKYLEDADAIRYKLNHSDYETRINENWRWLQEQLPRDRETSLTEYQAILEQFRAQEDQIEQERADKLAEIRDKIAAEDRTAFENRLADIEKEKDSWIQAGMDKLEADELAQKKREQLEKEVAEKVSDIRQSINAEFQTDLEKQIAAIQKEQQAWVDMGVSASEAAELAGQKMELAFEKAVDKAKSLNQSLEDKIFAQEHSQYETDVRKLQQEVAQKAQEYQKAGIFDENARALLNRYYNNALRDLNAKAGKGGDYTKSPTGANSGFQFIDYTQAQQQQIIGTFTKENTARQSVINSLTAEQRKRLEESGALDKIIAAQNSFATSTEQAADNIQDASQSIEIIHGDQVDGGDTGEVGKSFDEIIAEIIPKTELQQFGEQLNQTKDSLPIQDFQDAGTAAQEVSNAQIEQTKSAQKVTEEHSKLAETAARVKEAFEAVAEMKKSGLRDTDVSTKSPTKSSLNGDYEQPREKVHLQTTPKDTSYKLEDLGFDLDIFSAVEGVLGSAAGAAVGAGVAGLTAASLPALIAAGIGIAGIAAVVSGTSDNREERLNGTKTISADDGTLANIDLAEISLPLSSLDTNVQGIRDILQGKDAVADANAEATPDTSDNSSGDLLSPLNSIDETAKSILGELQSRKDENELAEPISELKSELSTQLSDAASQISENVSSPIQDIAQKLQDTQDTNVDDKISEISSTLTNDVAARIQEVAQSLQDRNAEQSAGEGNEEVTRLDDIAGKVQSIFDEMQAQRTAEAETQTETATESTDYLTPLTNIRDNVAGIWGKLQETTQSQDTAQTENIREILSPITQNINAPLSDLRAAIDNKEFTLPEIKFPTEVIVQPLNTISQLIEKIISALSNREPPKIEISPNMDIDLGGAYVFDDNLKRSLVDDITSNIVTRITEAVQSATASSSRNRGYGFGS